MRRPSIRLALVFVPFLALGVLPPAARAGDPAKQASAAYTQQAKARLSTLKADLKTAAAVFAAAISGFDAQFAAIAAGDDTPVVALVSALEAHRNALATAREGLLYNLAFDASSLLFELDPAAADESIYPGGFLVGDGGTLSKTGALAEKLLAKELARAQSLVDRSAKKLRSKTDVRMAVAMGGLPERVWVGIPGGFLPGPADALRIEFAVTLDRGGYLGDGRVWVSGIALALSVNVNVAGPSAVSGSVAPGGGNGRWRFTSDPMTEPLGEGNYLVYATLGEGSSSQLQVGME